MWPPIFRTLFPSARNRSQRRARARSLGFRPQIEILENRTLLSVTKWTGLGADTNWSTPRNWSNGVPAASDMAVFDNTAGAHLQATVDAAFAGAIDSLDLSWNGTLTVASPLMVANDTTFDNGTLTGNSDLTVDGTLTWSGGAKMTGFGSTTVAAGGVLYIMANGNKTLDTRTLVNSGTAVYQGTSGISGSGTIINNGSFEDKGDFSLSGSLTFNNAGTFTKTSGTGTTQIQNGVAFNNSGTVLINNGTLSLEGGDVSSGSFTVTALATLQFSGGTHFLTADSAISGNGTVIFSGGVTNIGGGYDLQTGLTKFTSAFCTANFTAPITSLGNTLDMSSGGTANFSGGAPITVNRLFLSTFATLSGSDDVTVTGQMTWSGGMMSGSGAFTIASGATLIINNGEVLQRNFTNAGTMNWTSGNITLNNGGSFTNSGTLNDMSDHSFSGNGGIFTNSGSYVKSAGTGETNFSVVFNNSGSAAVNRGTLTLNNGGNVDGSFAVAGSATLNLSSGNFTFSPSSSVTGSGTVILNAATTVAGSYDLQTGTTKIPNTFVMVNFTSPVTSVGSTLLIDGFVNFSGGMPITVGTLSLTTFGTLTGSDDVTVTSSLSWKAGMMSGSGSTIVAAGGSLMIAGSFSSNLVGRNFRNDGTASWVGSGGITLTDGSVFTNTGTFTDQDNHTLSGNGGTFNNLGTFIKAVNAGVTTISNNIFFANSGSVQVQDGKLSFAESYIQTDGSTMVSAGATLASSNGVRILGGVLSGSGTISGNVTNAGQVNPGGDGFTGVLTINGNYTQTATGALGIVIDGEAPGTGFDQLVITGSATLDGTLSVSLGSDLVPNSGDTFQILMFGSARGAFATTNIDPAFMASPLYDPHDVSVVAN